jgi:two-component system alkaline phosphatase synthesis response regulator PhoP
MTRILIVEDEPDIVLGLREDLRRQGYETEVVTDGEKAVERGREGKWDLILLDVMLPKLDGFDVCRELRRAGVSAPIILLTARSQEAEKELGLDSGADDYVTKPYSLRELRARIRARLRRGAASDERVCRFGNCVVDFERAELQRDGQRVELTAQEFRLLEAFFRHPGRLLSRDQLINTAWGTGVAITDRVVDQHVFNLRKKIEPEPARPRFLVSVRGLGYRFEG